MIWLLPAAWLGAVAIAAPIVIHLIARPRPSVQPFPTLRFLPDTARAALRRRRLSDVPLLLVRCAIVIAAVAALAGPLLLTRGRRAGWNGRVITETIDDSSGAVRDRLPRAIAALAIAPPGRRAIVMRSSFPIGSITDADVAAVPSSIGLTFERTGQLPATREIDAPPVLIRSAEASRSGATPLERDALTERSAVAERVTRRVMLDGARTSVRDGAAGGAAPIEIEVPADARSALDAVLAERVLAAPGDRRARLLVADQPAFAAGLGEAAAVRMPWIADAIARIAGDADLRSAARESPETLTGASFDRDPWHVIAWNRNDSPLAAAAADRDGRLLVATVAQDDQLTLSVLLRSIANALAPPASFAAAEVVAIPDATLRAWSRPPGPVPDPRTGTIDEDDRRVLWIAVLLLLGIETWMLRTDR